MTFDYGPLRETATRLLEKYGIVMQLLVPTAGGSAFDPTKTEDPEPVIGVLTKYKNRDIDGTRILAKDRRVVLAADQLVPTNSHRLKVGTVTYDIIEADPVEPGDTALIWILQVRG